MAVLTLVTLLGSPVGLVGELPEKDSADQCSVSASDPGPQVGSCPAPR